jgi:ribosomal protein S18 acetylase RimI-like enzyme
MITIRPITAGDAEVYRNIRLRALSDTPLAFGSTYARESLFTPDEWLARTKRMSEANAGIGFLAFNAEKCCGLIGCFKSDKVPEQAYIVSMWVAPEVRRQGIGARLIQAAEAWARQQSFREIVLDVTDINTAAGAFYQHCGFEFTGETAPYPNDPKLRELFMRKRL